jgi:hypothetical protein
MSGIDTATQTATSLAATALAAAPGAIIPAAAATSTAASALSTAIDDFATGVSGVASAFSDTSKPWYQSKGLWGGVIAIGFGVASLFGHNIAAADQATLVEGITGIGTVAGGLIAVIGRLVAANSLT